MKRIISALAMMIVAITTMAQYEPNTKWPYIYENFEQGTVFSSDNTKSSMELNVHLAGNVLHYVGTDGKVYKADDNKITRVEIGSDEYIVVEHRMLQIMSKAGNNLVLKLLEADFSRMQSAGGGAYGADLNTSSATRMNSVDIGSFGTPELGKMLIEKNEGVEIPVSIKYFFMVNNTKIEATKGAVENYLGDAKAKDFKDFQKKNKIKWKNPKSLKLVIDYISK